ncbi:M20 metallopeptidase family protein [Sphingomonas bacterium]|uniref:M20 metallopeptidase family protein n=1 Tax=Sphingomonas bacterium TaxID=1895847 RepID=UPI0015757A63|nr:M20 family metallopeptidase [Sphingomonas bacterium]
MVSLDDTDWQAIGEAGLDDAIDLRRAIHAEPEIGLDCPLTSAKIKAALAGLPLVWREGPSSTGLVAVLNGASRGNGRTVLLRGDMDALPMSEETGLAFASRFEGRMHACGHDSHTAMLVGAARALCARKDTLPGSVVFMFQPGEEGYHGARCMIDDGLLDDPAPDAAFALHISPNMPSGTIVSRAGTLMAATDTLGATITGRGGHAAMPHDCIDPIPIACEIVLALQAHIARRVSVNDPAVLSITQIHAGTAHNIVPQSVELLGTLRTLSEATRAELRAGYARIVEGIAAAHGATAEVRIEPGYPVTVNDERATALMKACALDLGGEDGWATMPAMMGAEDFSYVLQRTPGAMAFLGVAPAGSDPRTNPPLHNTRMTIDEAMMAKGIAMHCAVATRFLEEGLAADGM